MAHNARLATAFLRCISQGSEQDRKCSLTKSVHASPVSFDPCVRKMTGPIAAKIVGRPNHRYRRLRDRGEAVF